MTINVTAVNDAPAAANGSVTAMEDTAYVFTAADFGYHRHRRHAGERPARREGQHIAWQPAR